MTTARGFDTATQGHDGRVLVAGGNPGNWDFAVGLISSAELYDPNTGTFSPTGSMTTARDVHTATLLLDGRVLVTGGDDRFLHPLATAELYDPKAGSFGPTGPMATPRDFHVATLLADGRVLVTGGSPFGMDSASGQFLVSASCTTRRPASSAPPARWRRRAPPTPRRCSPTAASALAGGAVSLANGETGTNSLASAELVDPKDRHVQPHRLMSVARTFQQATTLTDGRVLVTGGSADGWSDVGNYLASAEIYDPKTGLFATTGAMLDGVVAQTATRLTDGRVLVAGGR